MEALYGMLTGLWIGFLFGKGWGWPFLKAIFLLNSKPTGGEAPK